MTTLSRYSAIDPATFRDVGDKLIALKQPLLVTHQRADGDALGSLLALSAILDQQGIHGRPVLWEPVSPRYRFVPGATDIGVHEGSVDPLLAGCDGVVILDTCSLSQLEPLATWLEKRDKPVIVVDHHRTRDEIADHYLVDPTAAAASLLIFDWAQQMDWPLPEAAVAGLFVGLVSDTGWFRFENTSPQVMRAAADLLGRGIVVDQYYEQLFQSDPVSTFRLRAAALSSTEFHADGTVALIPVSQDALSQAQATPAETENLANEALAVRGVQLSVALVETSEELIKCSFRSRGQIDVSELARQFGGGGHARAAGARITGSLDAVRQTILKHVNEIGR